MVVSFTKIENTARGVFLGAGWGKEYSVGPTEFHRTVGYPREQLLCVWISGERSGELGVIRNMVH